MTDVLPTATAQPGRIGLGRIIINDRVVTKVASRAAVEVADAGAATPRLLAKPLRGLGARLTDKDQLPRTTADVDGSTVVLELSISVRWPASVPAVTTAVREHVTARVAELTGLRVLEVGIAVTDLASDLRPLPRVR